MAVVYKVLTNRQNSDVPTTAAWHQQIYQQHILQQTMPYLWLKKGTRMCSVQVRQVAGCLWCEACSSKIYSTSEFNSLSPGSKQAIHIIAHIQQDVHLSSLCDRTQRPEQQQPQLHTAAVA